MYLQLLSTYTTCTIHVIDDHYSSAGVPVLGQTVLVLYKYSTSIRYDSTIRRTGIQYTGTAAISPNAATVQVQVPDRIQLLLVLVQYVYSYFRQRYGTEYSTAIKI